MDRLKVEDTSRCGSGFSRRRDGEVLGVETGSGGGWGVEGWKGLKWRRGVVVDFRDGGEMERFRVWRIEVEVEFRDTEVMVRLTDFGVWRVRCGLRF